MKHYDAPNLNMPYYAAVFSVLATCAIYLYWLRDHDSPPSQPTQRPKSSPPCRPHPYNPPDFATCQRLQTLLSDIRNHITGSEITPGLYLQVCQEYNFQLEPQDRLHRDDLNETKIREALATWPNFVPLNRGFMMDPREVIWGRVDEHPGGPHEIELNGDLVEALERAPSGSDLLVLLTFILVTTVFHQLSHHLTKLLFGPQIILTECASSANLLEGEVIGGIVNVLWETNDVGNMEKIWGLVLQYGSQGGELPIEHFRPLVDSIKTNEIDRIRYSALVPYIEKTGIEIHRTSPEYGCHPVAQREIAPGVVAVRGLGISIPGDRSRF